LFDESAIRKLPSGRTARLKALFSSARVAGPPSPEKPAVPLPATVVMIPLEETFRIRWLPTSAIRKPPSGVGATANGMFSSADVAGPPSPLKPWTPVPATVVIVPLGQTLRTRRSSRRRRCPRPW
jgi:hypothetical protein